MTFDMNKDTRTMLNRDRDVKECDTTGAESGNTAGCIKKNRLQKT
jgi:hypothetical protein